MRLQRYLVLILAIGAIGTHLTGFSSYADAFNGPNLGRLLVELTAVVVAYITKTGGHEAELADAHAVNADLKATIRDMPFAGSAAPRV